MTENSLVIAWGQDRMRWDWGGGGQAGGKRYKEAQEAFSCDGHVPVFIVVVVSRVYIYAKCIKLYTKYM